MSKRILIVTNRDDLHADLVAGKIAERGGRPFRLNADEFPAHFAVELAFDATGWAGALAHVPSGDAVSVTEIGAVWLRKKGDFSFASPLAPQEKAHARAEMEHLLLGLLHSLDCAWMSHPGAIRSALWKGEQLQRAARMGFAVPPSIVTNRRAAVDAFRASSEAGIAFKTLTSLAEAAEQVGPGERVTGALPTTRITDAHREVLDAVAELPCFFQHYVPKLHELRVTVIGEALFAARIHSQDDPRTRADYRDFSAEIRYEAAELPAPVARRCLDFVHSYGLAYGAIDLIVTPDEDHVFLENNPAGQFLFVEQLVPELDMSGAVADWLLKRAESRGSPG